MPKLDEMLVFAKVAETRSFIAAARALGLPRTTVSRRIAQLEARLGQRLLQRNARSVSMTEPGRLYYERATELLGSFERLEHDISGWGSAPRGRLRISTSLLFGHQVLPPIVAEYLRRFPDVDVDLHLSNQRVDLVRHAIDVAVRAGPMNDSSFVVRRLALATTTYCASPSYLAQHGLPHAWKDLERHACIVVGDPLETSGWRVWGSDTQPALSVHPRIVVNSVEFARQAALQGLGVARLPRTFVADDLERGDLRALWPDRKFDRGYLYLAYPSRDRLAPKVRDFVDLVLERHDRPAASRR